MFKCEGPSPSRRPNQAPILYPCADSLLLTPFAIENNCIWKKKLCVKQLVIILIHCKLIEHVNQIGQHVGQVNFLFREMCSCSFKILSSNWNSVFIDNNLTVGASPVIFLIQKKNLNSICLSFLYRFWFLKWASRNIWGIKGSTILHC